MYSNVFYAQNAFDRVSIVLLSQITGKTQMQTMKNNLKL